MNIGSRILNSDLRSGWKNFKLALILLSAFSLIFAANCSKKSTTQPPVEEPAPTIDELMTQAWTYFEQGYFTNALDYFNQVLAQNSSYTDALNGKGWSLGIMGDRNGALAAFRAGYASAASNNSVRAGLAFTFAALDVPDSALSYGGAVLTSDSLWALGRKYLVSIDSLLDYRELRILMAENHYIRGQFQQALDQVRKLDPDFNVDVNLPEGQAALLAEIERLSMQFK